MNNSWLVSSLVIQKADKTDASDVGRILLSPHRPNWLFFGLLHGEGILTVNELFFHMRENEARIIESDSEVWFIPSRIERHASFLRINFQPQTLENNTFADICRGLAMSCDNLPCSRKKTWQWTSLTDIQNNSNSWSQQALDHAFMAVVYNLAGTTLGQSLSDNQAVSSAATALSNIPKSTVSIRQAISFMEEQIQSSLRLEMIAHKVQLSPAHLIKLFKRETGNTPIHYFMTLKHQEAVKLLKNTDLSIKEISWKLGFVSQYHFSRSFKQYQKMSPNSFRLSLIQRKPGGQTLSRSTNSG